MIMIQCLNVIIRRCNMVEMVINCDVRFMVMQEVILFGMGERLQVNIRGIVIRFDKRLDSVRYVKYKLVIVCSCVFLYISVIISELVEMMRQERIFRSMRGRWFFCFNGIFFVLLILFFVVFIVLLELLKNIFVMFIVIVLFVFCWQKDIKFFKRVF